MADGKMANESIKEIEDFLRTMRQAFNSRDLKAFRGHFWTDTRFVHLDPSGRLDQGWGAFEEVLDQEFRYLESVKFELRSPKVQSFDDRFVIVVAEWRNTVIDAGGRDVESTGRVTYVLYRFNEGWKIVSDHYSPFVAEEQST
jgi:uncharacterized protein (TIGR02246 family)